MDSAVREVLHLLDGAFGVGPERFEESLLENLMSVDESLWALVPEGGERSICQIVLHVGSCKEMYRNHAFEDGALTWTSDIVYPWPNSDAPMTEALEWLRASHQRLRDAVARLSDDDLAKERPAPWGALRPTRWLLGVLIQHDSYHAGEINHARSLAHGTDSWAFA